MLTRRRALRWLPPLVAFALLVFVWQLVALHAPLVLPTPGAVVRSLVDAPRLYLSNAAVTLEEALVGTAVSFCVAFSLAVLMCHVAFIERAVMPVAVMINVTPVVSIAPALVVAFGFGPGPKYIVTALVTFFPFLVNSLFGLRSVDLGALEFLQTLHATRREILLRLRIPGSLPFLFAAARVCLPLSIVGAVVAEFAAAGTERGLGSLIFTSASQSELDPIYGAVCCLALLGIFLTAVVVFAEHRLLSWHPSRQTAPR